jgi:hypothetical protein
MYIHYGKTESGVWQRDYYARQSLCRALSYEKQGKGHTTENCTVKSLCRALLVGTHGEGFVVRPNWRTTKNFQIQLKLSCTEIDARKILQKIIKKAKPWGLPLRRHHQLLRSPPARRPGMNESGRCWRWISVNLAMSLPLILVLIYYSNHWN